MTRYEKYPPPRQYRHHQTPQLVNEKPTNIPGQFFNRSIAFPFFLLKLLQKSWVSGIYGTVFFFSAEKFTWHSLTRFRFFFLHFSEKKIYIFFFPRKSLEATHSIFLDICKKRSKKRKLYSFLKFFSFWRCFFSQPIPKKSVLFFFPGKVYTSLTHSISGAGKKKKQHRIVNCVIFFKFSCKNT